MSFAATVELLVAFSQMQFVMELLIAAMVPMKRMNCVVRVMNTKLMKAWKS